MRVQRVFHTRLPAPYLNTPVSRPPTPRWPPPLSNHGIASHGAHAGTVLVHSPPSLSNAHGKFEQPVPIPLHVTLVLSEPKLILPSSVTITPIELAPIETTATMLFPPAHVKTECSPPFSLHLALSPPATLPPTPHLPIDLNARSLPLTHSPPERPSRLHANHSLLEPFPGAQDGIKAYHQSSSLPAEDWLDEGPTHLAERDHFDWEGGTEPRLKACY